MFIHDDFFLDFSFWLYSGIGWNRSNSTNFLNNYFIWSDTKSGVEPELFQGKGDFMELEYFGINILLKTPEIRTLQRKTSEFFLLDALKTLF